MPNDIDQSQVQWDNSQQPDNGIDPSQVQWESDVSGDLESMHLASDVPPDQAARFKKLSDSTGASFNAVKDDPASAEKQAELPAWKKFAQDAPKAAKHLASDPVSFQVLKNDVQKLAEVEQSRSAGNNDPQKHGLTDLVKGGLSPLSFSALQKDVIDAYSYFKIEEHQAWLRHLDAVEKSKSWGEARQEVDRIRSMPKSQQYSEFHNLTGQQVTDSHLDKNKNLRNSYAVLDAVAGGIGRKKSREERAKYPDADKTYNAERSVLGEMSQEKASDADAMKVKGLSPYSPEWFVQEGLGSVAQTGKSIATALVPGLGLAMFYGSVGGAYLNDKEHASLSDADKLEGARVHAGAEYIGESLGTGKLLEVIKDSGMHALKKWMYAAMANGTEEHATEIVTQTYDAAKRGEIPSLNPEEANDASYFDKTLAFIDGQLQAYVLGAIGGGATGVGGSAVQSTGKAIVGRIDARNEAKRQAVIDKHNSLLGEVQKVEEMDATHLDSVTVRNALESMDDSERSLYVDPSQLLNQEGLSRQQLDELIPSAADQIDQALQVGGLVQVPRNELITNLAATKDLDNESITRHFKEDVANDSKFEMEMAGIDNQIKQVDILIAKSADSEKLKTQRSEVYQQALEDLNKSGKFKGGNDKRAAIWAAMATATAVRTGKTPMELYKETFGRVIDNALTGEVLNQYAGEKAQGADLTALRRAKQSIESGADPEQVRQETGWHKWEDGKWRFEVDDSQMAVKPLDKGRLADVKRGSIANVKLSNLIDHPELFKAYPFLSDVGVAVSKGFGDGGAYYPNDNYIEVGYSKDGGINRDTLLHEIQHAIQEHEGFAVGGSSRDFMSPDTNDLLARREAANEKITAINEQLKTATGDEYQRLLTERSAFVRDAQIDGIDIMEHADGQYKRLAGEVEARDAASRASMSAEDRRANKPYISQGIPDDQVIVRFSNAGQMNSIDAQPARSATPFPQSKTVEFGKFKTGVPVTFGFIHNTESATKIFGKPKKDSAHNRYIEPSGRYVSEGNLQADGQVSMISGELTFNNPLVLNVDTWKQDLFDHYGKRGKNLSQAIIADGHDGVVTVSLDDRPGRSHTSEILDLTTFDASKALYQNKATPRGTYDPATRNINLTHNADLSTFLHESGHMFLDIMVDMAVSENASESLKKDMDVTMQWFGIEGETPGIRLYNWSGMSINEKRQYHEKWAESFEQYLFEGKAPSMELAHVFSTFRQWLLHVYKSIAQFVGSHDGAKLNDEVRGVFDRMLATEEQIQEAEAARGLLPLFDKKPDNMTDAEWKVMQQAAEDSARSAFDQMTARSLRDMKWLSNAKNKILRKLQREADEQRREARMEARQQILSQNIYRAWQFLKAPIEGAQAANKKAKQSAEVDPARDSLLTAIAKLGGLNKAQAVSQYGIDPKDFHNRKGSIVGKPVLRADGGLSPDAMAEALSQFGYLPLDDNGKWDIQDLDDMLREEAAGNPQYSTSADYDVRLGEPPRMAVPDAESVDFVGGRLSRQAIREMYDDADLAEMQGEQVDPSLLFWQLPYTGEAVATESPQGSDISSNILRQNKKNKDTDLFVAHNLSEENLIHADELGGLAAPSLGVSRTTTGGFDGFGGITLLADKEILTDRDARTFDADVYSPRHPRAQENISYGNYIDLVQRIKANQGEVQGLEFRVDHDSLMRNGAQDLANSEAFQNYYLVSKGIIIKPKKAKAAPAVLKAIKYLNKNAKHDSAYAAYNLREEDWFKALAEDHYKAEFEKWKNLRDDFTQAELVKYGPFEEDGSLKYRFYDSLAREVESYYKKGGQDSAATRGAIAKHFRTDKGSAELQEFAQAELAKVSSGKQLVKYTKNGNQKRSAYTLENIVAEMTRELRGGEGFNYGAGSVRSAFAFEFKHNTIESIKSFKKNIVSKQEMDKVRDDANNKLSEALDKLAKFYKYDSSSWGYANDASSAIAEGPRGWPSAFKMTTESKKIITDLVAYLRNLPTEYFETKMQRAVGIGEFKTAVVPKGISARAMAILEKNGLNVVTYDPKKEGSRTAVIAKQEDILFQKKGKDSKPKNRTLESMGVLSDEGLHPDTVADLFGLSSGDELVRKLLTMPDPVAEIERLTDEIMLQRHADLATPEARERAAEAAIHNEAHVKFLATELTALNRAIGKPRLVMAAAKEYAAQIVSGSLIKDLNTGKYEAAEVKAGRAAEQAFRSGNKNEAALQKRNQVLHAMTVKMVNDAKGEMEKHLAYLKKFDKFNKKIDPDYQEQIDTLLERYDLRKKSLKAIQRSQNLGQWIEQQKAMGLEPVIPDKLLDESQRTNYKLLTVEEMRGLVDAVKNIEHLGRLKNRLLTDKAKRELNALADGIGKSIAENGGAVKPVKIERNSTMDRLSDLASGFFSMHRKLASIVRQLDGWKDGGMLWETMIRPMNEAGDNEAVMHEKSTLALAEVFAPLKGKKLTKKMYIPMIANSLSYEGRLAVALNWGNEGNRQRLMDGDNWGVPEVGAILATLTADDWKFVQGVWDHIATYKDAIGEQQKRLTGIEPSWVDATPFEIKSSDGQMVQVRGGYYPAKYDTTRSTQALSNEAAGNVFDQWKAAKGQGKTRDGFTKSRAAQVIDRPIRKDFGVITQHITEVTHRLAWQDWVVDMNRLLKKEQVDSSIRAHYGNEILEEMRKAIEDITTGDMTAQSSFERAINHLRIGTTIVGLGYNLTTSLLQPFGLTQSMVRIGPKWVAKGLSTWIGNPARMNERTEWVYSKSDFMRLRGKTMMREMNEILNAVRKEKLSKLEASYFYGIQKMQVIADMPTWLGQYEKSMAEFDGDESKAIALADQAVLDAQGGGQNKDLSRIQRGGPLLKLWTNFYSFFNTTYNLTREVAGRTDVKDPASVAKAAVDMLLLYSVPAVMGSILKGVIAGDDDDDELADRILRDQMSYLFGTMVGLREISAAFSGFSGYQGPAGTRFFSEVAKFGKQAEQGEADAAFLKSLNNIGGIIFHYPAGQINRTVEGANALMDGETDNLGALIFGKPK